MQNSVKINNSKIDLVVNKKHVMSLNFLLTKINKLITNIKKCFPLLYNFEFKMRLKASASLSTRRSTPRQVIF